MEKEFVPYELAVSLKALGFDEPCFGFYDNTDKAFYQIHSTSLIEDEAVYIITKAPLYQQVFSWFREKHKGVHEIVRKEDYNYLEFTGWIYIDNKKINVNSYWNPLSYEEAELSCLKKLIEILESKSE